MLVYLTLDLARFKSRKEFYLSPTIAPISGVSTVIPVYRSASTLLGLVDRLESTLAQVAPEFEVILVCDDGLDETWNAIVDLQTNRPWLIGIRLMRNYGQHNALLCGIRSARWPVTVTIDDDLQHPPEEIPKLLDELATGFDVVYGTPEQERHGLSRNFASRCVKFALKAAMGIEVAGDVSALRAFRTELRSAFALHSGSFVSIDVLLSWATSRFSSVRVRHLDREQGVSGYTNRKLMTHAINMLTGFSGLPLRIASLIGLTFTVFGGFSLAWVVGRYLLQGTSVAGFPFIAAIVSIFSGAQLACLGIIGEYLARIHFRSMGRPAYLVRTEAGIDKAASTATEESLDGESQR